MLPSSNRTPIWCQLCEPCDPGSTFVRLALAADLTLVSALTHCLPSFILLSICPRVPCLWAVIHGWMCVLGSHIFFLGKPQRTLTY